MKFLSVTGLFQDRTSMSIMSSPDLDSNLSSSQSDIGEPKTSRLWRNCIAIVMMPFLILGVPVLSIVFDTNKDKHLSWSCWIKHLLSVRYFNAINAICLLIALGVNGWFIYLLWDVFYQLFILGHLTESLSATFRELFETLPLVVLIDFLWWRGSRLGQIVRTMNVTLWHSGQIEMERNIVILAFTLLSCVLINLLPYLSLKWMLDSRLALTTHDDYYAHLPYGIINSMIQRLT